MKKLLIIAALLVGANLSYGQTTATLKTSAGSATGTVAATASTLMYVTVPVSYSTKVSGTLTFSHTTGAGLQVGNCLPMVSNDGTNFYPIKSGKEYSSQLSVASGLITFYRPRVDTVVRASATYLNSYSDTTFGGCTYEFPTGYKYVGFKWVGVDSTKVTISGYVQFK